MNNMHISIGQLFWGVILAPLTFYLYHLIHSNLGNQDLEDLLHPFYYFGLGIVLTEFCQYWMHRYSHKINILIAGHITHHSSGYYNMSTGIRINWFYRAISWTAYIPLAIIGYDEQDFLLFQVIMNSYNLCMHTQLQINYGWLRYILISPSFHKVHHAANPEYRDKNFGAIFSFFDLAFGTYVEEKVEVPCRFGISKNVESSNPL
jgi:alkylglycerol monooxygenase